MAATNLTAARLRELLHYDPDTGVFTWLVWRGRAAQVGAEAGSINGGYIKIMVNGRTYGAHRLAWLYMTGEWPAQDIDHIDTVPTNNAWANLRDVSRKVNSQNRRRATVTNSTGLLGVSRHHRSNRFRATIGHNGARIRLGWFDTPEQAHDAYKEAKRRLHEGCTI